MSEHDLTTPDGFAAMMREKEEAVGASPPDLNDPFAEVADPEPEEEQPEETPEEEAPETAEEEPVESAYDRGYARALGEQSEKLGEERARREAAEAYIISLQEQEQAPPEAVTDETWDHLENLYASQGGAGMMLALANDPSASEDLIDAGIALWKENDYRNAELYEKRMQRFIADTAPGERVPDPDVVELKSQQANQQAVSTLTAEYGREKLETLQPLLEGALNSLPQSVQKALGEDFQSADQERIVAAFRTLATLAEPSLEGVPMAAGKKAATVGVGSQSRVGSGQSDLPSTREELEGLGPEDSPERRLAAKKIMQSKIMAQQTSVQEELSKNS